MPAGEYVLDIYLNNQLIRQQEKIELIASATPDNAVEPCLPFEVVRASAIRTRSSAASSTPHCLRISETGQKSVGKWIWRSCA